MHLDPSSYVHYARKIESAPGKDARPEERQHKGAYNDQSLDIEPGTRFERYEILSTLGKGGMGEVYLALDMRLKRKVALKVLPAVFTQDSSRLRRFELEAQAASALNHPNIITIHEIGEIGGTHFIATEFIEGQTLRRRLSTEKLKLTEALDIAIQVATALAEAHAAGIIHRDIKPENLMIRPDGLVKVLDFGLAKLTEPSSPSSFDTAAPTVASMNTQTGAVLGTPAYMSPEQVRGKQLDGRTDIFSLGVLLYETIAGRAPFSGATAGEIAGAILHEAPLPLLRIEGVLPSQLDAIVFRALKKGRDERYPSTKEMLLDLKELKRQLEFETVRPVEGEAITPSVVPDVGHRNRMVFIFAALLLAIAVAGWFARRRFFSEGNLDSVAVLPFENLTHDPQIDYLSDGVTDSLINTLSQLPNLRVIARNSVFSYKNKNSDLQRVAQELNVRALLTGRILQQADTLDVRVELTDTRTNAHLWGDRYTRKSVDILTVQDDIARRVAEALRVHLTAGQQAEVNQGNTHNPDAYRLYLQGRFYSNDGSEESLNRAVSLFDQAIALDPRYALAYAARADTFFNMGDFSLPMSEAKRKAEQDVAKALALDDRLVEARTTLANIKFQYDWDFLHCENDFKQVIALNPNYAEAHHQYTYYLALMGRPMEAEAEIRLALQLDPVNPLIVLDTTLPFYLGRQYDQSIAQTRKALEMFPNMAFPHMALGQTLFERGDVAEGIAETEKAASMTANPPPLVAGTVGYEYAKSGRPADARRILADLKDQTKARYVPAYWIAAVYAGLGEPDNAFTWLEKAYQDRSWWLVWLKMDPKMDSLRPDSRFVDLMRRVGFP